MGGRATRVIGVAVLGVAVAVAPAALAGCAPADRSGHPEDLSFEPVADNGGEPQVSGTHLDHDGANRSGEGVIVGQVIGRSATVRRQPSGSSPVVARLDSPTETGAPLVFQLVDTSLSDRSLIEGTDPWVEVHLPIRPNGSTGWVRASGLSLTRNPYRIEIDTGDHRMEVYRGDERWIETSVAIGTGATPTPRGHFYVIELLQPLDPGGLYGPFAFGLSGFSETLLSFAGGDGVIGIHGTDEPEALGTDVSHGCVRVHNDVITEMAGTIPLGTPVVITD